MALFPDSQARHSRAKTIKSHGNRSLSLSVYAVYFSNSILYQFQRVIEDSRNKSDSRFLGFLMR